MKKYFLALVLIKAVAAAAHEGHDHDAPTLLKAPKGGVIKSLEKTNVEVVSRGKNLKIYLYDKEKRQQKTSRYNVRAQAQLPRTEKLEEIPLSTTDEHFEATFDAKGMHRYTLILTVKDGQTGHDDRLTFTIEPKK
ncbi:MAG: hypothetical protein AB7N80_10515 [Bdellovibrionales bacterium]